MDNMIEGIYVIPPEKVKREDRHLPKSELQEKYYQGYRLGGDVN